MKKKVKNGFTLIEILAVIIILAILALILTPIVTNIIGKTKLSAAERSVDGYVKAINYAGEKYQTEHEGNAPRNFDDIKDDVTASSTPTTIGIVTLDSQSGDVLTATFRIENRYNCNYDHGTTTCTTGPEIKETEIGGELVINYEAGMTWQQCIATSYCSTTLEVSGSSVKIKNGIFDPNPLHPYVSVSGTNVKPTDVISETGYELDDLKCFVAGTKILTQNGLINIEEVQVGDYVYSYDEVNNVYSYNKVINTHSNEVYKDKTTVTINGEEITSTSEHNYYTTNRGWIAAKNLTTEDEVLLSNGTAGIIEKVETIPSLEEYQVYNLTVDNSHTFFVGENSVLVHNAGEPTGAIDPEC